MRGDPAYPEHLALLPDAPDVLFVKGELPADPGVAVVGTRKSTAYGRGLARAYGRAIAAAGWSLVSGLARGIDGEAHRGTVAGDGVGVAVLGSGIDVWYPVEHRSLGEELLAGGGAIVSEYPPGSPPEAWRFPPRNRIISGVSGAVVVVEAGETGGALITAARAVDQGRMVLAVPGDIDRRTSRGTNLLIRDGAIPVFEPGDLIEAVSLILGPPPRKTAAHDAGGGLAAMIGPAGITLEELVAASDLPASEVLAGIGRLEAGGVVEQRAGRFHPC
jgi:DNA processing protein